MFCVLFSQSARAASVQSLDEYVWSERREVLLNKKPTGFRLMHLTQTQDAAREIARLWQRWQDEGGWGLRGCAHWQDNERSERQEKSLLRGLLRDLSPLSAEEDRIRARRRGNDRRKFAKQRRV